MILAGRELKPKLLEQLQRRQARSSRRELARYLCSQAGWFSPGGQPALMSARKALAQLTRAGHLSAPVLSFPAPSSKASPMEQSVGFEPLSGTLESIGELEILLVPPGRSPLSHEWNQFLDQFHYLKSGPLCGAQLRYLVRCHNRPVAAMAFSAAAWQVECRDDLIGWSPAARRENLHLVVNNSRFLIPSHVEVPNLASHVLGRVLRCLPQDWQERYGYRPVLVETFVDKDRYRGTCYCAANFCLIGMTQGRTRQDPAHKRSVPRKYVLVYKLSDDYLRILRQMPEVERLAALPAKAPPAPQPEPADWAEQEFGKARLGDKRLVKRCCQLARDFYARPNAQIPQACGSRAGAKAAWRFFDHPQVTMDHVLCSHYQATVGRMQSEPVVLAVQDTTSLNYTTHGETEMLGPIGTSAHKPMGMLLHSTLAFNLSGTPLGLLHTLCWTRDESEHGKRLERVDWPFEAKEEVRWLRSLEALEGVQAQCPNTQLIAMGDCESDIYELFVWATQKPLRPKLLIRAYRQRVLAGEPVSLWPHVHEQPLAGRLELKVSRRDKKPSRVAQVSVRFAEVALRNPARKGHLPSVRLWAILALEEHPPSGVEAIEWMLLTTLPVTDFESAVEKIRFYSMRFGIEVWHRVLKSGCKVEERQLGHAERLEGCLSLDMVVAWRVFYLTKLGRETPDVPCTVFFEEHEWKALAAYFSQSREAPEHPPLLREAVRMVGQLGGFLGRKSDGEPGTQTLWRGLQRLDDLSAMFWVMTQTSDRAPTGVRPRRYG